MSKNNQPWITPPTLHLINKISTNHRKVQKVVLTQIKMKSDYILKPIVTKGSKLIKTE